MSVNDQFLNELSDEARARLAECTTIEEVVAFIEEQGISITDDQLKAIAGGLVTGGLATGPLGTGPLATGPLSTGPLGETGLL